MKPKPCGARRWEMILRGFLPGDADELLALEPQEIAEGVLKYIASFPAAEQRHLNRYSFGLSHKAQDWPLDRQTEVLIVLMEGWLWLERLGLIIPRPGSNDHSRTLSREGQRLAAGHGLKEFYASLALPRALLHQRNPPG